MLAVAVLFSFPKCSLALPVLIPPAPACRSTSSLATATAARCCSVGRRAQTRLMCCLETSSSFWSRWVGKLAVGQVVFPQTAGWLAG